MERKRIHTGFWFVLGPMLLYWLINFLATFVGEIVIISDFMMEHASIFSTYEEMQTFMLTHESELFALIAEKAVELTAFGAAATLLLTVTLHVLDVKKAKAANLVSTIAKPSVLHYGCIVVFGAAICIALNNLMNMANLAFYSDAYKETAETFYSAGFGVQILCLGFITPIAEEFLFRGIIYRRYRLISSMKLALTWSTLLFALAHGNMVQMIYAAVLGVFLGYVYEKFGTIIAPICMHIVVNLTSLIVTRVDGFTWMFGSFSRLAVATIGCSFIAASVFVIFQRMENRFPTLVVEKPKDEENITPNMFG